VPILSIQNYSSYSFLSTSYLILFAAGAYVGVDIYVHNTRICMDMVHIYGGAGAGAAAEKAGKRASPHQGSK
jgi:hypothetical protein